MEYGLYSPTDCYSIREKTMDHSERRNKISPRLLMLMISIHILGMLGLVYVWFVDGGFGLVATAVVYYFICHLSITIGAHRYFTHEAFKLKPWLAYTLASVFSGTSQNSLYWWVGKHLEHHRYEDQRTKDPHTPHDGFWHSHMLWMLKRGAQTVSREFHAHFQEPSVRNRVIKWHRKHHRKLELSFLIVVPGLLGFLFGNAKDFAVMSGIVIPSAFLNIVGGILVIGFTRLVFQYHGTWVVNSVGHSFGRTIDATARNFWWIFSPVCGLLTVGEAYHANHHVSPGHWKLGRTFGQLDPGAWVIRLFGLLGQAFDFKEPPDRKRSRTFS